MKCNNDSVQKLLKQVVADTNAQRVLHVDPRLGSKGTNAFISAVHK